MVVYAANIQIVKSTSTEPFLISDSSDSDSEDIPARVSPAKLAKSTSLSSKTSMSKTVPPKPEESGDEEEIDEDETQSQNSSTRDSRSPIVFNRIVETSETAHAQRSEPPEFESNSEEEENGSASSEGDEDDEQEEDESTPKSKIKEIEMQGGEVEEEQEEESEGSESESEEGTEVQVPKSSPPILPVARFTKVSAAKPSQPNNSKTSITEEEMSTQDEIDQQLTSSMFEVRTTVNSSAVPSSSSIRPPQLKYGASLTSLNTNKPLYGSIAVKPLSAVRSSQPSRVNLDDDSRSESEEESDDNTTSSSDEEEDDKGPKSRPIATATTRKSQPTASGSEDESENSSNEDSSEESADERTRARNELAAQIASLANSDIQVSFPSPKAYKSATQEVRANKVKKVEKKVDKYVFGQKFSMPI
jgi:hypothetical protein